ncbi:MAG: DUF4105 domain-containing protein, partial [Halofilum sp. (in: g-proteobacteria)]|nr:DUF4105 domain-containing protein [Halofilum sp. (in: g-proteobacteria)]
MPRLSAILLLALCAVPAALPAAPDYGDELIERARATGLHEAPMWQRLLHYVPAGGGVVSEVDSADFFLAAGGKRDAAAELAATLRAFFRPAGSAIGPRDEHPQCRFIGRFHWLDEQLGFDRGRMEVRSCPQYRRWRDTIDPHSLALVFPAAYLNNPSSMFGHTLLRIDPPPAAGRGELAAYAINFAAQTEERNGVLFAVKGLTGMYPGRYSVRKYYELVNDYSEIESRDIWSYPLDFTPAEIDRMLRHLWEMEAVSFDYYFLSENCSYQLLRLLETARPGLSLADGFFYQAEPTATLKRVVDAGLTDEPRFRPALVTRIRDRLQRLPPAGRDWVGALVAGEAPEPPPGLAPRDQAIALETAFDLLKHRQSEGVIDSGTYGERALPILRRRSQLPPGRAPAAAAPDTAPHRGHDATRVSAGLGSDEFGSFAEFGFRPSFHGLTERAPGFTEGAQIEVLDTRIRVPEDEDGSAGEADLEELSVVDIVSLARRGPLIKPLSWRFRGGYRRVWLDDATAEGSIVLEGGVGPAWGLGRTLTVYGLGQLQLLADRELPKGASAGAGLRLGALWQPRPGWALHAWAEAYEHPSRLERTLVEAALEQTLALSRRWAIDLRLAA